MTQRKLGLQAEHTAKQPMHLSSFWGTTDWRLWLYPPSPLIWWHRPAVAVTCTVRQSNHGSRGHTIQCMLLCVVRAMAHAPCHSNMLHVSTKTAAVGLCRAVLWANAWPGRLDTNTPYLCIATFQPPPPPPPATVPGVWLTSVFNPSESLSPHECGRNRASLLSALHSARFIPFTKNVAWASISDARHNHSGILNSTTGLGAADTRHT